MGAFCFYFCACMCVHVHGHTCMSEWACECIHMLVEARGLPLQASFEYYRQWFLLKNFIYVILNYVDMGVVYACVCCIFPEKSAIKQCPMYFVNYNKAQTKYFKHMGRNICKIPSRRNFILSWLLMKKRKVSQSLISPFWGRVGHSQGTCPFLFNSGH